MQIELAFQDASDHQGVPDQAEFEKWLEVIETSKGKQGVAIRIVDESEMQSLNAQFRGKDSTTNVLAFPADLPSSILDELEVPPLGDIVICAPVVTAEAISQNKAPLDHWAHLTVHGILHLLGYDHREEEQATEMERLEVRYLSRLGIADPYTC